LWVVALSTTLISFPLLLLRRALLSIQKLHGACEAIGLAVCIPGIVLILSNPWYEELELLRIGIFVLCIWGSFIVFVWSLFVLTALVGGRRNFGTDRFLELYGLALGVGVPCLLWSLLFANPPVI
jgi:hypothetical protein